MDGMSGQGGDGAIGAWRTLRRRWVFHDRWYKLLAETVDLGDGRIVADYYTGIFPDVVLIAAVTDAGGLLFVEQYKHGAQRVLVEVPGGYLDDGESPLDAARRELREETGHEAPEWRPIGTFLGNPTKERGNAMHIFLATGARRVGSLHLDATEHIVVHEVPVADVYAPPFIEHIAVASSRLALELVRAELTPATA